MSAILVLVGSVGVFGYFLIMCSWSFSVFEAKAPPLFRPCTLPFCGWPARSEALPYLTLRRAMSHLAREGYRASGLFWYCPSVGSPRSGLLTACLALLCSYYYFFTVALWTPPGFFVSYAYPWIVFSFLARPRNGEDGAGSIA